MKLELDSSELGAVIGALVTAKYYSRLRPESVDEIASVADPILKKCFDLLTPEERVLTKAYTLGPQQGWRKFFCHECNSEWRDYTSPSGSNCPRCGEWEFPVAGDADPNIPVDAFGNLIK